MKGKRPAGRKPVARMPDIQQAMLARKGKTELLQVGNHIQGMPALQRTNHKESTSLLDKFMPSFILFYIFVPEENYR
jgi:hypothetical protein